MPVKNTLKDKLLRPPHRYQVSISCILNSSPISPVCVYDVKRRRRNDGNVLSIKNEKKWGRHDLMTPFSMVDALTFGSVLATKLPLLQIHGRPFSIPIEADETVC